MPPVYALISFFSFRFFRSYTYYSVAETGELSRELLFSSSVSQSLRLVYEVRGVESFSEI